MEGLNLAFYFIVYIALVVFFIRFIMYISEKIGLYNFMNKCIIYILNKFIKKINRKIL